MIRSDPHLVRVQPERSDEPARLACVTDQHLDVALHVSVSSELRQCIFGDQKELTIASVVPLIRDRLWGLWAVLGAAESEVVGVSLVTIAPSPNIFTPARTLAVSTLWSRSKVVRIEAGGDPLIFGDRNEFEVFAVPEIAEVRKSRHAALNVAEVLEGDAPRPADKLVAVPKNY